MKIRNLLRVPAFAAALLLPGVASAFLDGPGGPSPHDNSHLLVVRPGDFRVPPATSPATTPAAKPELLRDKGAQLDGTALSLSRPVIAPLPIKHAGRYAIWLRVGVNKGFSAPLNVTLTSATAAQSAKPLLETLIADGSGSVKLGGPDAFKAYAKQATSSGVYKEVAIEGGGKNDPTRIGKRATDDLDLELKDLKGQIAGARTADDWVSASRLEQLVDARPFYWWHAGTLELAPGEYQLALAPAGRVKSDTVLLDAAMLTTADKLTYPYIGDLNAPRASYIRFRIDRLPKTGLKISAGMRIHSDPWSTPVAWLNPARLHAKTAEAHVQPGFTRWYRLQDIERAPAFGAAQAHLSLTLNGAAKPAADLAGATQFAVFPHQDNVLREIDWHEPEGLHISLATDFETQLHQLRTLREHAREHYDFALRATGEQLFPLTRGDLYFGNGWGNATGECADYMNKTLRLLGMNSVSAGYENIKFRQLYGWSSQGGHYWPPAFLPFDEADAKRKYDAHYRDFFSKSRDFYASTTTFQIADEPGEISRGEMTAPFWRFGRDERGEKWEDVGGGSDLNTRRVDLQDSVLETRIEKHGQWIGIRVALDDAQDPKRYAYWHLGRVSPSLEVNIVAGRTDRGGNSSTGLTIPGASIAASGTAVKIVHHGRNAALFINGKLIQQHTDLAPRGGFGFTGAAKTIRELRVRPVRPDERLLSGQPDTAEAPKPKAALDDSALDDLTGDAKKTAVAKSLEKHVEEDWLPAGGIKEAHAGFRKWAAAQGVKPELFGKKSWDDVRMLTLPALVSSPADARLFYWSRKFSGYLTARMFNLAAEAIHQHAPNPAMRGYVALSGHSLYFPSEQPLDTFQLAQGSAMTPGISDWMSLGSWFWDSHQAVAFSIAPYNAGARRYGQEPLNHPMMHCVGPSTLRAYTMLGNNARVISYWNFGPSYAVTEGYWSEDEGSYRQAHLINNRAAQVDDVLARSQMRPSRVAMLYSMANEYWNAQSSFADKRASFLALSHEYFQPELVTEEQVASGALQHYDALYVLDPVVATAAQDSIKMWTQSGGLLWTCADALARNEFNEPGDLVKTLTGIERELPSGDALIAPSKRAAPVKPGAIAVAPPRIEPVKGQADFLAHSVVTNGLGKVTNPASSRVRARYDDGSPAWLEASVGKGRVVYLAHRVGLTYTARKVRPAGNHPIFSDLPRTPLTQPLHEAKVERELLLSDNVIMASPMSSADGTVILLHNMQPTPRRNLRIGLKEPAAPHSVEIFADSRLVPQAHEFRDGRVWLTLPELAAEQMILVRRKPAPADPRTDEQRERTLTQLGATDPAALSAGAWFAGFHPEWKLSGQLVPLLRHANWEVRRAAAEALGRVGDAAAGAALVALLKNEKDAHVFGDAVLAVARLNHPQATDAISAGFAHTSAFARLQSVNAAETLAKRAASAPTPAPASVSELATKAVRDPDLRVRQAGIGLFALVDPAGCVKAAGALSASSSPTERAAWIRAIAERDAAFAAYRAAGFPGGIELLLGVAAQRTDPAISAALRPVWQTAAKDHPREFALAARRQRDPALARELFAQRAQLPQFVADYLTLILENTFDARLGNVVADWEKWLSASAR